MDDWPTDAMTDAAERVDFSPTADTPREHIAEMLSAALSAAPDAEGWIWCDNWNEPTQGECLSSPDGCPGPHRTLIIGPTVEKT